MSVNTGHLSWTSVNPLPIFHNANQAYYSVVMSTCYYPVPFCRNVFLDLTREGPWELLSGFPVLGEISSAESEKLILMALHENIHKFLAPGSMLKLFIHLLSAQSYQSIWNLINNTYDTEQDEWERIDVLNMIIRSIMSTISMAEELFATAAMFDILHKSPGFKYDLNIEDEFVYAHANFFGNDFNRMYKRIGSALHRFGTSAVYKLVRFSEAVCSINVDENQDVIRFQGTHEHKKESLLRLSDGIRLLESTRYSRQTGWDVSGKTMDEFFSRHLAGYKDWLEMDNRVREELVRVISAAADWWESNERGLNPVKGMAQAAELVRIGPYPTISRIQPNTNATEIGDDDYDYIGELLYEKVNSAYAYGRRTVAVEIPREIKATCFLPRTKQDGEVVPSMHFDISTGALQLEEPNIISLAFFEGLRAQVEAGYGLRCPILPSTENGCDRGELVMRLWEAGERVKENRRFSIWERPRECLRSSALRT